MEIDRRIYLCYTLYILSINFVYMKSAIITLKVEPKVKKEAKVFASSLGFSLSSLISGLLVDVVKRGEVSWGHDDRPEVPNARLERILRESQADYDAGRGYSFDDPQKAIAFLDEIREGKIKV